MNTVNILLVGAGLIISKLRDSLKLFDVKLVSNFTEAKAVLEKDASRVVLAAEGFLPAEDVRQLYDYLGEKNRKYLAICQDKADVFTRLNSGASDAIVMPPGDDISQFASLLSFKARAVASRGEKSNMRMFKGKSDSLINRVTKIILIGASTGGTEALDKVLRDIPADCPPILIVQHMPALFTRIFANRLHGACKMSVWEAEDGDELRNGLVLIAPGKMQMRLQNKGGKMCVSVQEDTSKSLYIPSVDELFLSAAKNATCPMIASILTGMGRDGAEGLLRLRQKGARTLGQDKDSCVVYGMPKAAYEIGAVEKQVPIGGMAKAIMGLV